MHSDSMLPYLMPFAVPDAENPFGVPDWRNLHEYPDPELTPLRQWRWQFLRRDPSYRSSWETFRTNVIEWSDSSGGTSKHDETARRYGLCELISPAAPQLIDHWGLDAQTLKWVVIPAGYSEADVRDFVTETRARGFFLAAIDPSAALSSQLDRIQTEVSSWSPEFGIRLDSGSEKCRSPNKKFRLYLRLIDARQSGVEMKEITATLRREREYKSRREASFIRSYRAAQGRMAAFVLGGPTTNSSIPKTNLRFL